MPPPPSILLHIVISLHFISLRYAELRVRAPQSAAAAMPSHAAARYFAFRQSFFATIFFAGSRQLLPSPAADAATLRRFFDTPAVSPPSAPEVPLHRGCRIASCFCIISLRQLKACWRHYITLFIAMMDIHTETH